MLNALRILFLNELQLILREKVALFWIFLFPFFFMAIMLMSSGRSGMLGDQRIEIVDHDQTSVSQRYIAEVRRTFSAHSAVHAKVQVLDRAPMAGVRADVVRVTIPKGFANAFKAGAQPIAVQVAYDYSSGFGTLVAAHAFTVLTAKFISAVSRQPFAAKVEYLNTSRRRAVGYLQYMLTGILVMSMMTAGMNNTCIGIVAQRERNTFKLMSCLPLSTGLYLVAILLARLVILLLAAFVLLIGGRWAYGIPLPLTPMQYLSAGTLILAGGVTLLSMGIAMASRISRVQTALFVCNIVYLSLLFASNLTIPMSSFPTGIRRLLLGLPTSQFVIALRDILIQGSSVQHQWPTLLSLTAWALGGLLFARLTFKWHGR